jgi:lipopolysaccharide/colanic/teichoic acid biosynthesis glycosyltransferase
MALFAISIGAFALLTVSAFLSFRAARVGFSQKGADEAGVPRWFGAGRLRLRDTVFAPGQMARCDLAAFRPSDIDHTPLVSRDPVYCGIKRLSDIVLSLGLIVFTTPLLIVVAAAIRVDSPGPIFYRQIRLSESRQPFVLTKFRTMRVDAERDGAVWAVPNDERITRVGRILRLTRIDEIPQVLAILHGRMSFIGPRPERPEFFDMLAAEIPHYAERLRVKPGLTGWAQVNAPYAASVEDAREKLCYDLYYIRNYSLLLDLRIVLKTVRVTLFGIGSR